MKSISYDKYQNTVTFTNDIENNGYWLNQDVSIRGSFVYYQIEKENFKRCITDVSDFFKKTYFTGITFVLNK